MLSKEKKEQTVIRGFARSMIRRKARCIAKRNGFSSEDIEDIEQELRLYLWQSLDQFDPAQGHINVFITTVIERAKNFIVRDRQRKKRDSSNTISLGEESLKEALAVNTPDVERLEVVLDVAAILAPLSDDLRDVAESLKTRSVSDVARELNLPRSTLQRLMEQLRQRFEDAKFREML